MIYTEKNDNPSDGEIYLDLNTYKMYISFNNNWFDVCASKENSRNSITKQLCNERKEKLKKIYGI